MQQRHAELTEQETGFLTAITPHDYHSRDHQLYAIARLYHLQFDCLESLPRNNVFNLDDILNRDGKVYYRPSRRSGSSAVAAPIAPPTAPPRSSYRQRLQTSRLARLTTDLFLSFERRLLFYSIINSTRYSAPAHQSVPESESESDSKSKTSLAAVLVLVGLLLTAATALLYSVKELYSSIKNIINDKKVLRSYLRIASLILGIPCMIAILFTFNLPGLIVAAGFIMPTANILCCVIGAVIGSGLGALINKYVTKLISALFNQHEINPTSPEKYKLSESQQQNLIDLGVNITKFNELMQEIRDVKKSSFGFLSLFPWTQAYQDKNRFNIAIEQLKNGEIIGKIIFNGREYDLFDYSQPMQFQAEAQYSTTRSHTGSHVGFGYGHSRSTDQLEEAESYIRRVNSTSC